MASWEVWRHDGDGHRHLLATYHDRVQSLARTLVLESGHPHGQRYEIVGSSDPVVITNRDLYLRLIGLGDHLAVTGRPLLDYLCALWVVSRELAERDELGGDLVAAMLEAAAVAMPVRPEPSWLVTDLSADGPYSGFEDFTKVLCTQIADLVAFEESPPGALASLGVDAPPRVDGGRATIPRWFNFDPPTYLECAAAGAFGGWDESDGRRVRTSDIREPGQWAGYDVAVLGPIGWGEFAAFLEYGQAYE